MSDIQQNVYMTKYKNASKNWKYERVMKVGIHAFKHKHVL